MHTVDLYKYIKFWSNRLFVLDAHRLARKKVRDRDLFSKLSYKTLCVGKLVEDELGECLMSVGKDPDVVKHLHL